MKVRKTSGNRLYSSQGETHLHSSISHAMANENVYTIEGRSSPYIYLLAYIFPVQQDIYFFCVHSVRGSHSFGYFSIGATTAKLSLAFFGRVMHIP